MTGVYFSRKSNRSRRTSHWLDIIEAKHFYNPFVFNFCINLSATQTYQVSPQENQSEGRRSSHTRGGCHSPFLVSSWQVTAITWAKVTSRQTVILESNEGPMSACQTCSVLTHSRRETRQGKSERAQPPSYSIQTEKIQISLSGAGSWMRDHCKLQQAPSSTPPLPPSLSHSPPPLSSSFFLLHFKADLLLRALAVALKDVAN